MTILYQVKTGHTKKVLKAFAKLYTERGSRRIMFRFSILAIILFTLPRALHAPDYGYWICWGFGIFVILLALMRPYISYLSLLLQDKYYKEGTEILLSFGHSSFEVRDGQKNSYKYHLIKELYADAELFYLHMEDGDLFVLPKSDFTQGSPEDFYEFLQRVTGKQFEGVNLNVKQKFFKFRMEMEQAEADHDKKLEDRKQSKKNKRK